jgi:hypothetical protein
MEENLRIRFVGFIYGDINYIVDLDEREVSYKPVSCGVYRKLDTKISTFINPIDNSLTLSFKSINGHNTVEVEVYPQCIKHCSITLTNTVTHEKTVLAKEYYNFDYFLAGNLLDKDGNIFTFVDYNDVFSLTEEEIEIMFKNGESYNLIKRTLDDISIQKNFSIIIKNFLESVKVKMDYPSPLK